MKIFNIKNLVLLASLLGCASSYAQVPNTAQNLAYASTTEELKTLFNTISSEMSSSEEMLNRKDWGAAITSAKSILDRSSVVMPKTKVVERIYIKDTLGPSDLLLPFDELRFNQQQTIATALGSAKGGYYMDLLNLYKRARVLYSWAYYNQFKSTLINRDLESLKNKLISVVNLPLYVYDSRAADTYLVFDSDIAGLDQAELFNREVYTVLLGIKELHLTETDIERLILANKTEVFSNHVRGLWIFAANPVYQNCYNEEFKPTANPNSIVETCDKKTLNLIIKPYK